jgi:ketosteroid isomerase-like protein
MSRENVELVRTWIDDFNRRDLDALRAIHDPDVEVDWSASRGLGAGVYQGIDAVLGLYADAFDAWEEIIVEPDCLRDAGESVVVPNVGRVRGREGIEVLARSAVVFTVRRRKVSRVCLYQEMEQALQAVGVEG